MAFAAALLHTINHAVFKALLFLGAGAFERAAHELELDRLGGLLRRMPWSGAAFLVGAGAIAGSPPLNGFVSEWLTLQALLHLALTHSVGAGIAGALALAALALTAALAVYCFVKVVGLVLLGQPRRPACAEAVEGPWPMRWGLLVLAAWCVVLGAVPGPLFARCAAILPGSAGVSSGARLHPPGTGGLPALALAIALACAVAVLRLARGRRSAAPDTDLGVRAARRARAQLDERRLHQARAARARSRCCGPNGRSPSPWRAALFNPSPTAAGCRC